MWGHMSDGNRNEPWADQSIRPAYELALGRFLVLFNEMDDRISVLIALALNNRSQGHLLKRAAIDPPIGQRTLHLELLSGPGALHNLAPADFDEMRALAKERNVVAHGHFDQNPFDGSFQLSGRGNVVKYDTDRLGPLTARCIVMSEKLGVAEMYYWENLK